MEQRMKKRPWSDLMARAQTLFGRFRIPLLVLALGALLLLWPSGEKRTQTDAKPADEAGQSAEDTQQALRTLLAQVEGVGRVELLLRLDGSDETFYQTDVRVSGETREETTVFSSSQSAQKTPVVTRTQHASYLGAVVVCDGADSASVRLRVIQAVSALTGLGSDKISVIKMKQ